MSTSPASTSSSGTTRAWPRRWARSASTGHDVDAAGLAEIGVRDDIIEALHENVDAALEDREKQNGPDVWAQVERFVLLRTIDTLWVEHLTELDDMRRGIGLRGYGGIDPLNEFKREAFKLYEELRRLHPPPGGQYDLPRHGPGSVAAGGTAHALQPGRPGCGQRHVDVGWKRLRHGDHVQRRRSNRRQRATAGSSASSRPRQRR